jgi:tetratricopeptide (TPR) repeat protein
VGNSSCTAPAGAYLASKRISLARYQKLYQQHRARLLTERHNKREHPEPVATTWDLSFQAIEQQDAAFAELLRFCSFLAPDAIPEVILTNGASSLGPVLAPVAVDALRLGEAIAALRGYSLLERDAETETVSVHRLVQAVLYDSLPPEQRQDWRQRAVEAVNASFPRPDFPHWSLCERLLPHVQQCTTWIDQDQISTLTAAHLLNAAGYYLHNRGRYAEAELLYQRALAIRERLLFDVSHPHTATILNNLALLYQNQGMYGKAEPLYKRVLAIRLEGWETPITFDLDDSPVMQEKKLVVHDLLIAISLNNLAMFYHAQGRYEEAEPLLRWALADRERLLGASHPDTASSLNNLAVLYRAQGKYEEAEPLYERVLAIYERELGASHPRTASSLNNLAALYNTQGKYAEAEPLCQRALEICLRTLGKEHPTMRIFGQNYANLLRKMGREAEARAVEEGL